MAEKTDPTNFRSWKDRINFNTIVAVFLIVFSIVAYLLLPYQIEKPAVSNGAKLVSESA